MSRLFLSQEALDIWLMQGHVRLDGEHMVIDDQRYTLLPAVRFVEIAGGQPDRAQLLGKVKTERQLIALGAEHYMESVIIEGIGYQVQQGFVGQLAGGHGGQP
ncbi:MAG: hypothetical protein KC503_26870 [Myxococcales bacterium]|nr:hypothetical protein [Myxococcales bacterium]